MRHRDIHLQWNLGSFTSETGAVDFPWSAYPRTPLKISSPPFSKKFSFDRDAPDIDVRLATAITVEDGNLIPLKAQLSWNAEAAAALADRLQCRRLPDPEEAP